MRRVQTSGRCPLPPSKLRRRRGGDVLVLPLFRRGCKRFCACAQGETRALNVTEGGFDGCVWSLILCDV